MGEEQSNRTTLIMKYGEGVGRHESEMHIGRGSLDQ